LANASDKKQKALRGCRTRVSPENITRLPQLMKSFRPPFSKGGGDLGQSPESLVATSETSPTPFLVLFAAILPKRTERNFSMLHILFYSVFFFETAGAKKMNR
jgi:hypothetical protein